MRLASLLWSWYVTYGREAMDWADREICSRWFERNDMIVESEGETDTWLWSGCSLTSQ
jgi:hypothetical protein